MPRDFPVVPELSLVYGKCTQFDARPILITNIKCPFKSEHLQPSSSIEVSVWLGLASFCGEGLQMQLP